MALNESVVVRRGKEWLVGSINKNTFVESGRIKRLKDVKHVVDYISLSQYLKREDMPMTLEKTILKETELSKIYILSKPINPTAAEFEQYWWKGHNRKCKKCVMKCKQSSKTEVYYCNQFKAK